MNAFQKVLAIVMIVGIGLYTGCKKDDPVTCNWGTELQNETDALTAAATTFSNDPTSANCQAYKDAYQDYIDALKDYENCATTAGTHAEWQSAINSLQESLDQIQC